MDKGQVAVDCHKMEEIHLWLRRRTTLQENLLVASVVEMGKGKDHHGNKTGYTNRPGHDSWK
eukprot:15367068-Ditylum_brightwellii.AAC.1